MADTYNIEKKKRLAGRIQKITESTTLKKIKTMIIKYNPELALTKNNNGYFMQFQNLSNKTYIEIEKYLDKLEKQKLKDLESEIMECSTHSESNLNVSDMPNRNKNMSKKLRLTNTESHILNRVRYEKELKKNDGLETEESMTYFGQESEDKIEKMDKIEKPHTLPHTDDIFMKNQKK